MIPTRNSVPLDKEHSTWLRVPRSIKTTSVKPSGAVSLLCSATPGVHWEHGPYYIRRMRVSANDPLAALCRRAGFAVEPDAYATNTLFIAFPIPYGPKSRLFLLRRHCRD